MIELENAGYYFKPGQWIFRNHSFQIKSGEIVAILGPNGRGKTTLIKNIMGLLSMQEGQMRIGGDLGYVPQFSTPVFPYSILDMILMGRIRHLKLFSTPGKNDYKIARKVMDQLGIRKFEKRKYHQLSGGERQLVLIARALVSNCRGLVLDEPASALDFKNQDIILKTLRLLSREQGLTILFTSHFPQHAVHIADRVLLMFAPDDYHFGSTEEIMADGHLNRLYGMEIKNITLDHKNRSIRAIVPLFS